MRPARSTSAPLAAASVAASGDAWTPAAQTVVRASIRDVLPSDSTTSTPSASTPTTRAFIRSSTPSRCNSLLAFPESRSPKLASGSLPPSSSSTRTDAGSNVRNSPFRQRTASSRTCPASSTPVGPAPTMTIVSYRCRSAGSVVASAISKAPKMRRRSSLASSMVFMPGA